MRCKNRRIPGPCIGGEPLISPEKRPEGAEIALLRMVSIPDRAKTSYS